MAHYFFSDVHLGYGERTADKKREERLIRFLDSIRPTATSLFIVGDLFDYWFEYKTVVPKYHIRTLAAIAEFVDTGCEVHYVIGNHDFGHRDFFGKEIGVIMHEDDFSITLDGKKFYISHGDGKAANDLGYRMLKKVLRNKINLKLYSMLHPNWGIGVAAWSSRRSRAYTGQKDYGTTDGLIEFAKQKLHEGYNYVVMGHRHKPQEVKEGNGTYINLGDWLAHSTYAVCENGILSLKTFTDTK